MNKANFLRVADAIENHEIPDLGFNMGDWIGSASPAFPDLTNHRCGTTACIAGWAAHVATGETQANIMLSEDAETIAGDFLGHPDGCLFYGRPSNMFTSEVTPNQAVNVLRYAAEYDVIDWDDAQEWAASKGADA